MANGSCDPQLKTISKVSENHERFFQNPSCFVCFRSGDRRRRPRDAGNGQGWLGLWPFVLAQLELA